MRPSDLQQRLNQIPRRRYLRRATALEPLDNLTRQCGGPRLWVKRDDGIGPGGGGNKGRKLEFLIAEVQEQRRQKVITYGGLQSNHARMTAAACAALGLEAHLFFFARRPPQLQGNLLLGHLCGARLHFVPFGGGGDGSMTLEMTNRLVRVLSFLYVGPGAYFIPVGGHNVTGCLGYVSAACELQEQVEQLGLPPERTTVVLAAGTGGTLAGLMAGFALLNSPIRLLGLDIGKLWKAFPSSIAHLATALCQRLGSDHRFDPATVPLLPDLCAGPGYASLTTQCVQAIHLAARTEGLILDPIYTGKAFGGLLDLIQAGRFGPDEHVIFLHTGGLPGLWAYEEIGD
jgi:1-aminocyclopropane-1-carboxylate deaminase/D-cysteine desulfhydrase-like pyridoxal-dependent ACC family enzyme